MKKKINKMLILGHSTHRILIIFNLFFVDLKMEDWLSDVKQLRIPRPKFGSNSSPMRNTRGPREPPRDYNTNDDAPSSRKLQNETEELRQAIQDKL